MKRHLLMFALVLSATTWQICAEEQSFVFLLGTDSVNVTLDYSRLTLEERNKDEFDRILEIKETEWKNLFVRELNESNEDYNLTFGNYPSAQYTLLVQFVSAGSNASLKAIFRIIDLQTVSEKCAQLVTCRGGVFGEFYELFGEAVERLGEEIGDIIKDNME